MLKRCLVWLLAVFWAFSVVSVAQAEPKIPAVPTSSIYAQDYGDVLSRETESRINRLSTELQSRTGAQIVVVTIPTLDGNSIEDYSLALFRKWGIGDRKLNNGVLILFAVAEGKSRIEIGYGLEGALPDAKTGRIQDERMRPYINNGDFNTALMNGYLAVLEEVAKEYKEQFDAKPRVSPKKRISSGDFWDNPWDNSPWWAKILFVIVVVILFLIDWIVFGGFFTQILFMFAGRGGGGGGGGFGGGSGGGGGSSR